MHKRAGVGRALQRIGGGVLLYRWVQGRAETFATTDLSSWPLARSGQLGSPRHTRAIRTTRSSMRFGLSIPAVGRSVRFKRNLGGFRCRRTGVRIDATSTLDARKKKRKPIFNDQRNKESIPFFAWAIFNLRIFHLQSEFKKKSINV